MNAGIGLGLPLMGLVVLFLAGSSGLCGCSYTLSQPVKLTESVRVEIAIDDARLVRAQAYLQASVATALQSQLGWKVSPTGSARIALTLKQEAIQTVATTPLDVPASWSVTISGSALFDSHYGHSLTTYQGTGYTTPGNGFETALSSEPAALQAASDAAATWLVAWLEAESKKWK
jgi:hypothetical protein